MPQRPVSHQLEDVSRRRFEELLPPAWVVRDKVRDYGIDLEVEIFDESGSSTGIMFLVQLKATDQPEEARRLRIKVDHLRYFDSLELPTLIARYYRPEDSFHVRWHFNVDPPHQGEDRPGQTVTIHFGPDDLWTDASNARLQTTLSVLRRIRSLPPTQPVALAAIGSDLSAPERYQLDEALHWARELATPLAAPPGHSNQVLIEVIATPRTLRVLTDPVSHVTLNLKTFEPEALVTAILYGCAALLRRHRLHQHAALVASAIVERAQPCDDKEIAMTACLALSATPRLSVQLAILNDLHREGDMFGFLFFSDLRLNPLHAGERYQAMLEFMEAVREDAAARKNPVGEAAAYYTMGNIHRSERVFGAAVHHYNRARKLRPEYLQASYFLLELAGGLFLTRHYGCAAKWYLAARSAGATGIDFVLGDALLFAGKPVAAQVELLLATQDPLPSRGREAEVKLKLAAWLIETHGPILPVARAEARRVIREAGADIERTQSWSDVLGLDVFDEWSNYNLGMIASGGKRWGDAWAHFLLAAFGLPNDLEAWANAMTCAMNARDDEALESTVSCAMRLSGREAYSKFRQLLIVQRADDAQIAALDELSRRLWDEIASDRDDGLTIRLLGDEHVESARVDRLQRKDWKR